MLRMQASIVLSNLDFHDFECVQEPCEQVGTTGGALEHCDNQAFPGYRTVAALMTCLLALAVQEVASKLEKAEKRCRDLEWQVSMLVDKSELGFGGGKGQASNGDGPGPAPGGEGSEECTRCN